MFLSGLKVRVLICFVLNSFSIQAAGKLSTGTFFKDSLHGSKLYGSSYCLKLFLLFFM